MARWAARLATATDVQRDAVREPDRRSIGHPVPATGDGNNWDNGENFYVDNFTLNVTRPGQNAGVDTLNGGVGDDTYSFTLGDGNDVINERQRRRRPADRISILSPPSIRCRLLPVLTQPQRRRQRQRHRTTATW